MSHWTIPPVIDWHYTMAWLPASLLKTHRRLSACETTMRVRFVYERRRYATMVKVRHGLATLKSNNSFIYGQKHKVWVLVFLVRTSEIFWVQNWADLVKFSVLQQNRIVYSNSMQETLLSTVSHLSYSPLFQGPHFFTKKVESNILYDSLLIGILSVWWNRKKKYRNYSCESFCYVKGTFLKNARATWTSIFSICVLR